MEKGAITTPQQLKRLNISELNGVCEYLRERIIGVVENNGGHLSSNLGAVELTVALHYVFDERDKIVWDVGHQSYVHKILTGRGENFCSLRQKDGLSGFPDYEESVLDCFNTGHAGTAISAALNRSCRILEIISGTANSRIFENRGPLHMSIS